MKNEINVVAFEEMVQIFLERKLFFSLKILILSLFYVQYYQYSCKEKTKTDDMFWKKDSCSIKIVCLEVKKMLVMFQRPSALST